MTELLMKVFNRKEYWKRKVAELHDILLGAEFRYKKAVRWHKKCSDLAFEYKLARLNLEKAWAEYTKARGY